MIMPPKIPASRPIVAVVRPRSAPSAQLSSSGSWNTVAIPLAVPCPPAKPISNRDPNRGFTPNTGVNRNAHSRDTIPTCIKLLDHSQPRPAAASWNMVLPDSCF